MNLYQVQPGDTAHSITQKFLGNASRVHDLLRNNRHKPVVITHGPYGYGGRPGTSRTFQSLQAGEHLIIPPKWSLYSRCPRGFHLVGNRCVPNGSTGVGQTRMVVEPSAQNGQPIVTALGPSSGKKPCCDSCAHGGPCEGCPDSVKAAPCSTPKAPISIPGSTSFPVGFGQSTDTSSTGTSSLTIAGDAVSAWAVPLTIAVISAAAGFGLAYVIAGNR